MSISKKTVLVVAAVALIGTVFWHWYQATCDEVCQLVRSGSHFELGQYYFNATNQADGTYSVEQAERYYQKAAEADPTQHELLWYQLGRTHFIQGEFDAAITAFHKQQEYFGDDVSRVYYMLGLTYGYKARHGGGEEDWRLAEEYFLQYLEEASVAPWPRVDLAWIYFSQGKYEAMLPVLEEGLGYYPENPWLLNMYGLALLNSDRIDEAREQFQAAYTAAEQLDESDWGNVYPGNDPALWGNGIEEFKRLIKTNLELVSSA